MSQFFVMHPKDPQPRLVKHAVKIIHEGGVIVYPTDSSYALGCQVANKNAFIRICQLRQLDEKHHFTLVCRNLSDLGTYAEVGNATFRLLKAYTPGPYTFILKGSKEVPRRLLNPKRKTIGLRIPDNRIVQALLVELDEPLMSVSLDMSNQGYAFEDAQDIYRQLGQRIDLVIDGGPYTSELTTIVDLVEDSPKIVRVGKGDPAPFE